MMLKISCFIMNPPYNCYFLHTQICNEARKYADKAIAICPINKSTRYKTCEFLDKPFDNQIVWNNVFLLDLKGEENDFFSMKNSIFVKHTTDPFHTISFRNEKYCIRLTDKDKNVGWNCILDENRLDEIQKFIYWLNTTDNKIVQVSKHIFTIFPPRYNINRLWEIYNAED